MRNGIDIVDGLRRVPVRSPFLGAASAQPSIDVEDLAGDEVGWSDAIDRHPAVAELVGERPSDSVDAPLTYWWLEQRDAPQAGPD